jgi:hypothetical protein
MVGYVYDKRVFWVCNWYWTRRNLYRILVRKRLENVFRGETVRMGGGWNNFMIVTSAGL